MDMSLVGERFAQARASKGTQEGFARELGVGVRVLQRWEAGEVMPRWKTFVSFLQLTEVSADWLLGLSEEGGPSNRDQAHAAGESARGSKLQAFSTISQQHELNGQVTVNVASWRIGPWSVDAPTAVHS